MTHPYTIWRFEDAPAELRALSTGDADWIVEIPPERANDYASRWLEWIDGVGEPQHYDHPTRPGWRIAIGSH